MAARGWWSVGIGLGWCIWSISVGCSRRGLDPSGAVLAGADAGREAATARPGEAADGGAASDAMLPAADAGGASDAMLPAADAGVRADAGPAINPGSGVCDVAVMPARGGISTAGTLAAPGPYRPCDVIGGQSFTSVVATADGRRLAALGVGGQIQVLEARTLAPVATFARARGAYTAIAISADGTRVAAGAELDGELDVWSIDDHVLRLAADLGPVWPSFGGAVALSADGTRAAASSGPDTVLANVVTGSLRRYPEQRACCTSALAFVDHDRKLASARYGLWSSGTGDGSVALIDLDRGAETLLIEHNDIYGGDKLAVSADGTTVLTQRERVQIWDAATGQERLEVAPPDGTSRFDVLGLDAAGATFAVVAGYSGGGVWFEHRRAADSAVVDQIPFPSFDVLLGWSPAGLLFGRAGSAILAVVYTDVRAPRALARACSAPTVEIGAFSRDGSRLLDRSSGRQHVLDAHLGASIGPAPIDGATSVDLLVMSPDGRRLAWMLFPGNQAPAPLRVEVADVDGGAHATLIGGTPTYQFGSAVVFSLDGSRLAALDTYNGVIDVFDVNGARLLAEKTLPQPYEQLLGFSDDGEAVRFAIDGKVETLAVQGGTVSPSWTYPTPARLVASVDSRTIVVLGESATPTTTAYRDGTPLATMPVTGSSCLGGTPVVAISPDGGTVALGFACSRPATAPTPPGTMLYATTTGAFVQKIPGATPVLSWDGDRFASGAVIWCR